ncbi:hypothetical protein DE151_003070 [Clostridium beijerinckii]|nr:hypothetical protein [Clostridium beijerinckii]
MKQIWSMTKIEFYKIIRGHIPIYILAFYSFLLLIHMQDKTWEEFFEKYFFYVFYCYWINGIWYFK